MKIKEIEIKFGNTDQIEVTKKEDSCTYDILLYFSV